MYSHHVKITCHDLLKNNSDIEQIQNKKSEVYIKETNEAIIGTTNRKKNQPLHSANHSHK